MPRKVKKTPGNKKTSAFSPQKKTVVTRKGTDRDTDLDRSFLQLSEQTVSNVPSSTVGNDGHLHKSDAILSYLQRLMQLTNS